MGIFRRKVPSHLIPIHPDNAANKDWIIVLEAATIVGSSPERLRVARSMQERKIVKRYDILLRVFAESSGANLSTKARESCAFLSDFGFRWGLRFGIRDG